jgi:methionyl-tRNA formyltransferase
MTKVDLYLGSDIGAWVLQQISCEFVERVITLDSNVKKIAENEGFNILEGDANKLEFTPCKFGVSVHYPRIISQPLLLKYTTMYNLHPGYLPWGKGYFPVFWSLWEDKPAGATLHEMILEVDSGPIVDQIQVEYFSYDTGDSLFRRVREAEKQLFLKYWPRILEQRKLPSAVQVKEGSWHSKSQFYQVKRPEQWEAMSSRDIIKLARCLTFDGYSGLELDLQEKSCTLQIKIEGD